MKQNLNETLEFLKEHGFVTEKQTLNETTAMTAPDIILAYGMVKLLDDYIKDVKAQMAEDQDDEDVGEKLIAATQAIIDSDDLMDEGIDAFLKATGFWDKYNKAWEEYHEARRAAR